MRNIRSYHKAGEEGLECVHPVSRRPTSVHVNVDVPVVVLNVLQDGLVRLSCTK